jgi:peroxisomal membrane protein 4
MSNVKAIWDATSTHSINLGSYVFVFKTLLCLMRHLRGADGPINVLVAGALAGYRIFGKNNAINSQINMYILSRVLLGGVNALVKHNVIPAFDQAYPIYAGTCWALVMYLFYYHRGNMQKSIDTSMEYLYIASEHRPSKAAPSASAALVGGSASTLLSERGFGGVLYAVMEWCLQDL